MGTSFHGIRLFSTQVDYTTYGRGGCGGSGISSDIAYTIDIEAETVISPL